MKNSEEMEQLLNRWIGELHKNAPDSIGDLLHFSVERCCAEAGDYVFCIETAQWMQNAFGTLHGGIISTIMDQGMGMLATCLMEQPGVTPSVQLNVTFHRPLNPGEKILLKIHVDTMTHTLLYLHAEASCMNEPDKLCASGTGIFFQKHFS